MKTRYIKDFDQFSINENEDTSEVEENGKNDNSEKEKNIISDPPKERVTTKEPPVDELEEKGLSNKANLSSQ